MLNPEPILLAALVAALALPWLVPFVAGPVRMRARSRQAINPAYTPDDEARLPESARLAAADMRALGFEDRGTWRHHGSGRSAGWVVLLEHPRTRDVAEVLVVAVGTRRAVSLAFRTVFADRAEVATFNSRVVVGFPSPPEVTTAWLPELRDAASLYRVHEQLRDAFGGIGERIGADPAGFLADRSARSLAAWVAGGYYAVDEARGEVRPTWKGAVLVTWRLLWPVRPLYRAGRRRATRVLLDRLGVSLAPRQ